MTIKQPVARFYLLRFIRSPFACDGRPLDCCVFIISRAFHVRFYADDFGPAEYNQSHSICWLCLIVFYISRGLLLWNLILRALSFKQVFNEKSTYTHDFRPSQSNGKCYRVQFNYAVLLN